MPLFYQPAKDAERGAPSLRTGLHKREDRCPLVAEEFQWEVARGTCCFFDVTDLVALLEKEMPRLVPMVKRGPRLRDVPRLVERLCWLSKCFQGDGDESLVGLETVEVAIDWLENVAAASFGARAFVSARSLQDPQWPNPVNTSEATTPWPRMFP